MHSITMEHVIPFHDVDSMKVVWHGNYVRYLELARCVLLEKIGYDYVQMEVSGFAWPVVDMRIKYIKPLLFQQVVLIHASIHDYENRLKINYEIHDKKTGERLTTGYTVQVAVDMQSGEMLYESPDVLLDILGEAV